MIHTVKIGFLIAVAIIAIYLLFRKKKTDPNGSSKNKYAMELTKKDFLEKVVNYEQNPNEWKYLGDKPAVIDFYASWCGPCKAFAPVLEEVAAEYQNEIVVYKVNTEIEEELAAMFHIRSIPTILFIPMEGAPQMISGALPKGQLMDAIDHILLKR